METALLKSLSLLRHASKPLTEREITDRIQEDRIYVAEAFKKLMERKIVGKNGEFYLYQKTMFNERFTEKILAVYEKLNRKSVAELVVVGLLSTATEYRYLLGRNALLRVLEEEGYSSIEINSLLDRELNATRIRKMRAFFRNEREEQFLVPPAIPFYYISHDWIGLGEYEGLKERWIEEGFFVQEEDYLIANFPLEMAGPAKEYFEKEGKQIKKKLKSESFDWWYNSKAWWSQLR